MKVLVVARHGDAGEKHLSEMGKTQIRELAERLKKLFNGHSVLILSSPAPRALESAKILGEMLESESVEAHDIFAYGPCSGEYDMILGIRDRADAVVVVTHLESTGYLPHLFSKNQAWGKLVPREKGRPPAGATVLDCEQRTYSFV